MKETRADTTRAIGYALLLHALPVAFALLGLWWTGSKVSGVATGVGIEADLVDVSALSAEMQDAMRAPTPQVLPAPVPEDTQAVEPAAVAESTPALDTVEQAPVEAEAETDLTREREQEEKRRQEQIDLTEREQAIDRNEPAPTTTEATPILAAQSAARTTAAVDAAASTSPPRGSNGIDADLFARYQAALLDVIQNNWTRPGWVPVGQRCKLTIRQMPGGEVTEVHVDPSCPYDQLDRRSLEAAVLQAQSLPYSGFESVFQRELTLDFEAQEQ